MRIVLRADISFDLCCEIDSSKKNIILSRTAAEKRQFHGLTLHIDEQQKNAVICVVVCVVLAIYQKIVFEATSFS